MATEREVSAALAAFNEKRVIFGGIKSWKEQREAMTAALEAADRARKEEKK